MESQPKKRKKPRIRQITFDAVYNKPELYIGKTLKTFMGDPVEIGQGEGGLLNLKIGDDLQIGIKPEKARFYLNKYRTCLIE